MRTLVLIALAALLTVACDTLGAATEIADNATAAASAAPVVVGGTVVEPGATAQAEADQEPRSQPTDEEDSGDRRPGPLAPGETGHYGAPFSIQTDALALDEALRTCAGTGEACLVAGTVDRVCQVSGCWFTVAAPGVQATVRIRMQDYGFFVPRNALGADVTFEGTLELEETPQEEAQHYADDEAAAGGQPRVVDGPELTYEFMITGAELTMPAGS